ncbi:TPM domain-containing protein [Laspinema olomoucense]|uniref:TPM domain-containing protein n=1 Tax=Laspinema olomoucense TaxID=3231600 RepID=UPI0021BB63E2|nr:TPM domain-containing protein [Laspinema sp. D3c]MCT7993604.1 TPM domain-containing protein [Laspinema sp. D3c]
MKRTLWGIWFGFCLIIFPLFSHALTVQEVPNPRQQDGGWVSDMANILSSETENQLNQMISQLEATTGAEIAVVTVPTTAPSSSPKAFTTDLFNHWGIGKDGADNGLLFLTAVGERRVEVETGYAMESVLPDAEVGTILKTQVTPRFREGDFEGGIVAGTQALIGVIAAEPPPLMSEVETEAIPRDWIPLLLVGGGGLAAIAGGTIYRQKQRIFIEPTGRSRSQKLFQNPQRLYCNQCKHPLKTLEEPEIDSHLTPPERVAQQLGSVQFKGVFCATCYPSHPIGGVQILSYETQLSNVTHCPTCQELTVTRQVTKIVEQPTWNKPGKQWITEDCHCCDRHEELLEDIPPVEPPADAVFLQPTGRSRVQDQPNIGGTRECDRPAHCLVCRYPLNSIQGYPLQSLLTPAETTAQTLDSVKFIGWQCTNCYPQSGNHQVHIRGYIQNSGILECTICQELTVTRTEQVIQQPTIYSTGSQEIRDRCHCCGNESIQSIILPALPPPPPVYSYSSDSSDSSSSYSSSDSSSSSSSSSDSSDFGGGDSGGGGAGDNW